MSQTTVSVSKIAQLQTRLNAERIQNAELKKTIAQLQATVESTPLPSVEAKPDLGTLCAQRDYLIHKRVGEVDKLKELQSTEVCKQFDKEQLNSLHDCYVSLQQQVIKSMDVEIACVAAQISECSVTEQEDLVLRLMLKINAKVSDAQPITNPWVCDVINGYSFPENLEQLAAFSK